LIAVELEAARFARFGIGRFRAAARAGHRVEVDIVHHGAVVVVLELDLDGVADAHAHERAGDLVVEGPVAIGGAVGELAGDLGGFQIDLDALRTARADRRRQVGRVAHDGDNAVLLFELGDGVRERHGPAHGLRLVFARLLDAGLRSAGVENICVSAFRHSRT
jgi:hypothetical protein